MNEKNRSRSACALGPSARAARRGLLLLAVFVGGCIGPTDPVESLVWEGSLMPVGDATLLISGSAAIVSGQFNSQVGIGVEGVEPGVTLQWSVRRGNCAAEGEPLVNLSVFPVIEIGASGEGSSGVVLSGRVPTTQTYAAWVSPSAADAAPVACAVLARRD